MADKKFLDFLDRFDGGGMGKSGDKFEGGGLFSLLGNLAADPYGSEDKARMASRDAFYNAQGDAVPAPSLLSPRAGGRTAPAATRNLPAVSARPAPPTDAQRFGMNPPAAYSPAPPTDAQRFGMNPPAAYSPTPVNVSAPPSYTPHSSMQTPVNYDDGSGMTPDNNYPDPRQRFVSQLVEMIGPDAAESMMNSGMGEQAYQAFVANNYNMPNY